MDDKGDYVQVLVHKLPLNMNVEGYAKSSGKWLKNNLKNYQETKINDYTSKDGSLKGFSAPGGVKLKKYLHCLIQNIG